MKTIEQLASSENLDTFWELSDEDYLHRLTAFAEAYHKAKMEASPPVEVEPVAEVMGTEYSQYLGVTNHDNWEFLKVGTKLYTSPPDTEAKLKRAVEALERIANCNADIVPTGQETTINFTYAHKLMALDALKDIGEIK